MPGEHVVRAEGHNHPPPPLQCDYPRARKDSVYILHISTVQHEEWGGTDSLYGDTLRTGRIGVRTPVGGENFHTRPDPTPGAT